MQPDVPVARGVLDVSDSVCCLKKIYHTVCAFATAAPERNRLFREIADCLSAFGALHNLPGHSLSRPTFLGCARSRALLKNSIRCAVAQPMWDLFSKHRPLNVLGHPDTARRHGSQVLRYAGSPNWDAVPTHTFRAF